MRPRGWTASDERWWLYGYLVRHGYRMDAPMLTEQDYEQLLAHDPTDDGEDDHPR